MEPQIAFTITKKDLYRWKDVVRDLVERSIEESEGVQVNLDMQSLEFEFKPLPCGCIPSKIKLDQIPLESISCECGKYVLVDFIFTE